MWSRKVKFKMKMDVKYCNTLVMVMGENISFKNKSFQVQ